MHASIQTMTILTFAHVFVPLSNVPRGQLVHCDADVSQYKPMAHYVCIHFFVFACVFSIKYFLTVYVCGGMLQNCITNHWRTMHDAYTFPCSNYLNSVCELNLAVQAQTDLW
jgi:hypothetical protein